MAPIAHSYFQIDRSTDGIDFQTIGVVDSDDASYTDAEVKNDATYTYRVIRPRSGVPPDASGTCTVRMPIAPPLNYVALSQSATEVLLVWQCGSDADPAGGVNVDPAGMQINTSLDGVTFTPLVTVTDPAATRYSVRALKPNTHYFYQFAARTASGLSAPNMVDVWTWPQALPSLTATAAGPQAVDLAWPAVVSGATGFDIERSDDGGKSFNSIESLSNALA